VQARAGASASPSASSSVGWGGDDHGSSRPPVPWLDSFEVRRSSVSETADDDAEAEDLANNLCGGGGATAAPSAPDERQRALQRALAEHLAARPVDAVVVLAGGLLPDGGLPPWVTRRLDTAAGVRRLQMRGGCGSDGGDGDATTGGAATAARRLSALVPPRPPIVLSGGGTPHKRPPADSVTGHPLHESTACARYLMRGGGGGGGNGGGAPGAATATRGWAVGADSLLKETSSMDTLGNAYFSLVSQAVPRGWRRVAVVTSAFHLPRAKALFVDVFGAGGRSLCGDAAAFELTFVGARDDPGLFELPTRGGSDGPGGVDFGHLGGGGEDGRDASDADADASDDGARPTGADVLAARRAKELASVVDWKRARREHGGLESLPELAAWLHATHRCYAVRYQDEFGRRTIQDAALLASY